MVWKIPGWSQKSKRSYHSSERFKFANFDWFLGLYPNGDKKDALGYMSIYLFVESELKGKSVPVEFSLRLVNHTEPSDSFEREFKATYPIKENTGQGWGDRKFIKISSITVESGFVQDDTVVIECFIVARMPKWSIV